MHLEQQSPLVAPANEKQGFTTLQKCTFCVFGLLMVFTVIALFHLSKELEAEKNTPKIAKQAKFGN